MSGHPDADRIAPVPRISVQAFCETHEVAQVINDAVLDRRMEKAHVKVHMGGAAAAVEAYRSAPTPNVIFLESTADREELLGHLETLSEFCDSGTKVVVAGRTNDISLYRELMARGVSDYFVTPFGVLDIIGGISRLYSGESSEPLGKVIAITGAKGGVGASTVAHNIAFAIAKNLDVQTVIVDTDLPFGTTGLDFNQDPPQGIAEAIYAPDRLDANLLDRLLSKCSDKLSILAAPATLDRPYDLADNAFDGLIDILRGSTPFIIVDVPHGWAGWSRRMLVGADEIVIVTTPDLANLRNTKSLLDTLRHARPNDGEPHLIMNFTGIPKRPEISLGDFTKAVDRVPVAVIPFEPKLFGTAANNGQMIAEVEPGNKIADTLGEIARIVTGRSEARKSKRNLLDPFMARLGLRSAS